ncbi:WD repeat-containing protein 18 [Holothuria leucospilota]|uniref:WD repeat-containing protein 18 n=1 Tax=Holothuria leucospilota TaxID=206669 RepID=A0A9Q1C8J3_HOLLE|nr:WD repeat-containing protein 18 [Holothuria leucospilota]
MALPMEVVISSDSTGQMWNCCIWDPRSDCTVINYKGSSSNPRSLNLLSGQYILSADSQKPLLNMWEVQRKEQHHSRMVCPGHVSSLAVTPDSTYCFAGIEEKINVWQVSSGRLLAVLSRHFQKVTNLCCTDDGGYILSGGEDNLIMVWDLASILSRDTSHRQEPIHIWSQHSMPVTDLHCGKGGISSRAVSSSQDQTCKLWDIPSGQMLCSFVFDTPILSVTMDAAEQRLFSGGLDGIIYAVNLFEKVSGQSKLVTSEENGLNFKGHSKAVTCLSVSLDGSMLLSGSEDNTARVWHITSRQCVRTMAHKGAVTNARFIMMPPCLQTQTGRPTLPIRQFQRQLYVPQASTEGSDSVPTEGALFRLDYSLQVSFRLHLTVISNRKKANPKNLPKC